MKEEQSATKRDKLLKMAHSRSNSRPGLRVGRVHCSRTIGPVLAFVSLLLTSCAQGDDGDQVSEVGNSAVYNAPAIPEVPRASSEIFPATGRRGLVLNNCASCHAVACAAIGQRSPSEWSAVEESHLYYIPGLSIEDRGKIFDYLRSYFNDTLPEPRVPEELLEGGCPELSSSAGPAPP
jgi:hypothetical protein